MHSFRITFKDDSVIEIDGMELFAVTRRKVKVRPDIEIGATVDIKFPQSFKRIVDETGFIHYPWIKQA